MSLGTPTRKVPNLLNFVAESRGLLKLLRELFLFPLGFLLGSMHPGSYSHPPSMLDIPSPCWGFCHEEMTWGHRDLCQTQMSISLLLRSPSSPVCMLKIIRWFLTAFMTTNHFCGLHVAIRHSPVWPDWLLLQTPTHTLSSRHPSLHSPLYLPCFCLPRGL